MADCYHESGALGKQKFPVWPAFGSAVDKVGAPISIGFLLARCRTWPKSARAKPIESGTPTIALSVLL